MSTYDKVVKSATKPKAGGIKPKYIDPIIAATFSTDSSLQDVVRSLSSRLHDSSSIVIFKSLIIIHTMTRNGEVDNVLGQLSSQSSSMRLREVAARSSSSIDGPSTLNTYAMYLDERVRAYRELRHDVVRSSDRSRAQHNGSSNSNRLRRLTVEKGLLREISITQKVANALLQCSFFLDDLNDDLTLSAFRMTLKDLLAIFTAINEGIINMLEHYFEMAKTDAERALELYKRFCRQTEKVVAFLAGAKRAAYTLNMAIPSIKHAPVSLAGALEEYLNDPNFEKNRQEYKENKRIADGGAPSSAAAKISTTSASVPKSESKKSITFQEPTKPDKPTVKPPTSNQALQDFFESIDTEQGNNMFSNVPVENSFFGVMPQQTGFMQPQQTGFIQPQMTGYNPFLAQQGMMVPQMTGMQPQMGFGTQQQQQQQPFLQPQPTGFLQPQATGFNPFRQSLMPQATGMGIGIRPAGAPGSAISLPQQPPQQPQSPPPQQQQQQQQAQPPVASPSASAPKPLLAQKTGSRNPFAPPPGQTPPASPPPSKTGPSLNELAVSAFASNAPSGGHYGLGANGWDSGKSAPQQQQQQQQQRQQQQTGLVPQKTGLIGNIASEFALGQGQSNSTPTPGPATPASPPPTEGLGSLSLGVSPQPTGLGGSSVKPFKPSSSFGASLAANPAFGAGPNPFSAASTTTGSSLFNSNSGAGAGALQPQATGFGSSLFNSSSQPTSLAPQSTGFGASLFSSQSASTPSTLAPQSTGFGSSLFNAQSTATLSSQPTGFTQQQQQPLSSQPTGMAGIKPFQPTSDFGKAALAAQSNPQQQRQEQPNLLQF